MNRYYKILGLTPEASLSEVKKKFRSIIRKLHPDLNSNADLELFHNTVNAYNIIIESFSENNKQIDKISEITKIYIKRFLPDIYIKIKRQDFERKEFILYKYKDYCPMCNDSKSSKCYKCSGKGYISYSFGKISKRIKCKNCYGKGVIIQCARCKGRGYILKNDKVHKNSGEIFNSNSYLFLNKGNVYKKFRSDLIIEIF